MGKMFPYAFSCINKLFILNSILVAKCQGIKCGVLNEECDQEAGICKCGTVGSCYGKITGSYCDATNSVCKCGPTLDACHGTTDTCINQNCTKCGSLDPCMIPGETCQSGVCKCGTAESCANKTSGEFCDAPNNMCKCNATINACSGATDTCGDYGCTCGGGDPCTIWGETCQSGECKCGGRDTCEGNLHGEYCDVQNDMCKCSSHLEACSGNQSQCLNGACVVADDVKCNIENEIREGGICKCGTRETCEGLKSGAYCDAENSICKCTSSIDSCAGTTDKCTFDMCTCGGNQACDVAGEICQDGKCMCGSIHSCGGKLSGSYCDSTRSECKCSSTIDACNATTDRCINEQCTCGDHENLLCTGTSDRCTDGECKCGEEGPCSVDGEICKAGICMCGGRLSCEGNATGSYCDVESSRCKCSEEIDACSDGNVCLDDGTCGIILLN